MGYEIHIQRSENHPISKDEWEEYVKHDSDISIADELSKNYLWHAHPLGGIEGQTPWLNYANGKISTRKPDEFVTLKMFEIAKKLKAQLSDDENILTSDYKSELEKDTQRILTKVNKPVGKPWWKFW